MRPSEKEILRVGKYISELASHYNCMQRMGGAIEMEMDRANIITACTILDLLGIEHNGIQPAYLNGPYTAFTVEGKVFIPKGN